MHQIKATHRRIAACHGCLEPCARLRLLKDALLPAKVQTHGVQQLQTVFAMMTWHHHHHTHGLTIVHHLKRVAQYPNRLANFFSGAQGVAEEWHGLKHSRRTLVVCLLKLEPVEKE